VEATPPTNVELFHEILEQEATQEDAPKAVIAKKQIIEEGR